MQYPPAIRMRLLDIAKYVHIEESNKKIFEQGDQSVGYYVIIRGSVKIEKKHRRYKGRHDMPPIVLRTCYDGDEFGEISHFSKNIAELKEVGEKFKDDLTELLQTHVEEHPDFYRKYKVSEEMMADLEQEEVDKLNEHRTSATTMEPCDLLFIDKM